MQSIESRNKATQKHARAEHAEEHRSPERQSQILLVLILDLQLERLLIQVNLASHEVHISVLVVMPGNLNGVVLTVRLEL